MFHSAASPQIKENQKAKGKNQKGVATLGRRRSACE
jgi:hypothetical protein